MNISKVGPRIHKLKNSYGLGFDARILIPVTLEPPHNKLVKRYMLVFFIRLFTYGIALDLHIDLRRKDDI